MIAVIDYEIGNLRSVVRGLERAGAQARLVSSPDELIRADKVVLPGVAAFGDAIESLRSLKLVEPLRDAVRSGTPYLGFCLGLQLLFEVSEEMGEHRGLGLLGGRVERFDFTGQFGGSESPGLSIPHMGWNRIRWGRDCPMLSGLTNGTHVYFAHSYHVVPDEEDVVATRTEYGVEFVSAVWKDNIFATQFHPEKSQNVGLRLLQNFVSV
jgi:glutamine amidotransferase